MKAFINKIKLQVLKILLIFKRIFFMCKHCLCHVVQNKPLVLIIGVNAIIVVWCLTLGSQLPQRYVPYEENETMIDEQLQKHLELDKGRGCHMPYLDPFSPDVVKLDYAHPKVTCEGLNWVQCYHSECKVIQYILNTHVKIVCRYKELIYVDDYHYFYGPIVARSGDRKYYLLRSDYAVVSCRALRKPVYMSKVDYVNMYQKSVSWVGLVAGFRPGFPWSLKGMENSTNVLIFAFESTSRVAFIRRMPKSYTFLTKVLKATVLKSFNIVGDGTLSALLPMLTGQSPFVLDKIAKKTKSTCDLFPMIFHNLTMAGYRTAYFEDDCEYGTFQFKYKGFRFRPTYHYLRPFILEARKIMRRNLSIDKHCLGDTPVYKFLMDLTIQYQHLKGKKFIFTFLSALTHDDVDIIATTDDDFLLFLQKFISGGFLDDTVLVVMSDHGPRYYKYNMQYRDTPRGRLEERLPLMAIALPHNLKEKRAALRMNVDTLATPYDMHTTLLDLVGLKQYRNSYKVPGSDIKRGLSLLEQIPRNRSCSEAGVTPHWCACQPWEPVQKSEPIFKKASQALLSYINDLTEPYRRHCMLRTLTAVRWVKKIANDKSQKKTYQVKLTVGPGEGNFEGTMTYSVESDKFHLDRRDISRTSMYKDEPRCISKTHPHLNPYCYCQP